MNNAMILTAQPKQFSLKDDGQIYFQPDATNPLPGNPVARVVKGAVLLQPELSLLETALATGEDRDAVAAHIATWLKAHIYAVLEPLFNLVSDETLAEPVRGIALKLFEGTGIVSRGAIESVLSTLDQEARRALRAKKVRLGPLLVFLPDLNKPAAVHLRALLWSLFNDQPLPAPVPRDGAMSVVVDPASANADFYRAIGYPVFGPRAIRIDMLDRVINAVYDSAKEGKFQAQHTMAEWMGCPIADLYGVLTAMGHRHIETADKPDESKSDEGTSEQARADEPTRAPEPNPVQVPTVVGETGDLFAASPLAADQKGEGAKSEEPQAVVPTEVPAGSVKPAAAQKKPDLDWFWLRRGKAHADKAERPPRRERPAARTGEAVDQQQAGQTAGRKPNPFPAERYAPKKPFKSRRDEEGNSDEKTAAFRKRRDDEKDRGHKGGHGRKDDKRSERSAEPRVFTAAATATDNPFAVLQNLKLKSGE